MLSELLKGCLMTVANIRNALSDDNLTKADEEIELLTKDILKAQHKASEQEGGLYQCFHCLQYSVAWDGDFDFQDYGEDGPGIIHECHCMNCGAEITYRCPANPEEKEQ